MLNALELYTLYRWVSGWPSTAMSFNVDRVIFAVCSGYVCICLKELLPLDDGGVHVCMILCVHYCRLNP